jgi:hypothetical protein
MYSMKSVYGIKYISNEGFKNFKIMRISLNMKKEMTIFEHLI